MKYFRAGICILLIALMLSGCSLHIASSINDLISPISPFGDKAEVQQAMDEYLPNGYSIKNPAGGESKYSYNFFDIDNDGNDEAIAFYEPKDKLETVYMALLHKDNDKWSVVESVRGEGKAVYSVGFEDVNADGTEEIIVCWDVIANSTSHIFKIYNVSDSFEIKAINDGVNVNNYVCYDYDDDNRKEILLFEMNGATSVSAKAELYSADNNRFRLLGETKLDSHISTYRSIKVENVDGTQRVYADAIRSNGESMLTEIIYWSDNYDTIISPFYSYSTGLTKGTTRKAMIDSMDINDDGFIEIPTNHKAKLPKQITAVNWKVYKNTTLIHSDYSLLVDNDGYTVVIPDSYFEDISASYDADTNQMTVFDKKSKNPIFSITPVLKAVYDEKDYKDFTIVMENSGYYYLGKVYSGDKITMTIDELTNCIKSF